MPNYYSGEQITGVAISNESILILCTFGFATLGITLFLILRHQPQQHEDESNTLRQRDNYGDVLDQADVATLNRAQRRARAKYKMKQVRRDMAPVVQMAARGGEDDDINIHADEGILPDDVKDNLVVAEGNPNRRERQRLAKEMERNERKSYSLEAQRWREKNATNTQSDLKSQTKKNLSFKDDDDDVFSTNSIHIEEIFPQRLDIDDPLSDVIFWDAITREIKSRREGDDPVSMDELISQCEAAQSRTMTIREFLERLEVDGSVSIIDLADEHGISIADALVEIERWNDAYNKCGIVDSCGRYVCSSNATQ